MDNNQLMDTAKAYMEGVLWAAYGVRIIGGTVAEWQIDSVKEYASIFKEAEIDHTTLSYKEKEEMKHQWHQWLEATAKGIKDELRREGRLV